MGPWYISIYARLTRIVTKAMKNIDGALKWILLPFVKWTLLHFVNLCINMFMCVVASQRSYASTVLCFGVYIVHYSIVTRYIFQHLVFLVYKCMLSAGRLNSHFDVWTWRGNVYFVCLRIWMWNIFHQVVLLNPIHLLQDLMPYTQYTK